MSHVLKNTNIKLHLDLPSENYQLARFDWTGKITALIYKGQLMSGGELAQVDGNLSCGRGFYNEFGFDQPLGFEEAKVGGWFHKIGVGLLKKTNAPYKFNIPYEIQPAAFMVDVANDRIRMTCQGDLVNGYGYLLHKEIQLLVSGFQINYYLENTGYKTIRTNEYCHNFLAINQQLIGSDYILNFPFQVKPDAFIETVNPENLVNIDSQQFTFNGTPQQAFYFSNLSGNHSVKAHWELINKRSQIALSETGNFRTRKVNLWGCGHVISPELFVDIVVERKAVFEWSRRIRIREIEML